MIVVLLLRNFIRVVVGSSKQEIRAEDAKLPKINQPSQNLAIVQSSCAGIVIITYPGRP